MLILLQRRRSSEGFGFDGVVQPVGSRNRRGRDMTIMARTRKTRERETTLRTTTTTSDGTVLEATCRDDNNMQVHVGREAREREREKERPSQFYLQNSKVPTYRTYLVECNAVQ